MSSKLDDISNEITMECFWIKSHWDYLKNLEWKFLSNLIYTNNKNILKITSSM